MNTTHPSEQVRKPRVDFIGMGHMGSAMASRLLSAGYPLAAYDGTSARAEQLKQQKAGPEKGRLLDVLEQTAVLTPGQKAKLANMAREHYPMQFGLSLIFKDFRLLLDEADAISVPMPATAMVQQLYAAALAKGLEADFSVMVRLMEDLAGLRDASGTTTRPGARAEA